MALSAVRLSLTKAQTGGSKLARSVLPLTARSLNPVQVTPVATLKATHGEKYPYPPAFPYEKKRYSLLHQFYDHTEWRLGENSKVITVDGPVGIGKDDFGRRLAKEFDLKFFPSINEADAFKSTAGYDLREFNSILPEGQKFYDLKMFYEDADPTHGRVGALQHSYYYYKYLQYCRAIHHLLNTGQGVVIVNSVYSDHVYADTLRQLGYIKPMAHKSYRDVRENTICNLLKPHLCIYLEAPTATIRKNINKENNSVEVNSKVLTEKYLQTLDRNFRDRHLNQIKQTSEVMVIDWSEPADEMDMDVIAEELQWVRLDSEDADDPKFQDWHSKSMDEWDYNRKFTASPELINQLFRACDQPIYSPEIQFTGEAYDIYKLYIEDHPAVRGDPSTAQELGHNPYLKLW